MAPCCWARSAAKDTASLAVPEPSVPTTMLENTSSPLSLKCLNCGAHHRPRGRPMPAVLASGEGRQAIRGLPAPAATLPAQAQDVEQLAEDEAHVRTLPAPPPPKRIGSPARTVGARQGDSDRSEHAGVDEHGPGTVGRRDRRSAGEDPG